MSSRSPGSSPRAEGAGRPADRCGSLRIAYLLVDTALFGGVKVVLHQANLLAARGHRVTVVTTGAPPDWFPLAAELRRVERLDPGVVPESDLVVATYWSTLPVALACRCRRVVHYCQGYEGSFTHNREEHGAIEEAYRAPVPAMVVSPHLVNLLEERFDRPARVVPQPLEPFWRPPHHHHRRTRPRRRPRLLVASPFEIDWKGVTTALAAVARLRPRGVLPRLVRLSQWPLSVAEREMLPPDEYHHRLLPRQVARLMRGCDLLLAPSWEQEGFGLPALEAMACGVPVVASDVSCYRSWAAGAARLVPFDAPDAFAAAVAEILSRPRLWRRMRRAGLALATRYSEERSAAVAQETLEWALEVEISGSAGIDP